ncbi:MAG: DNA polymerase III subunit delta [Solobacterium sp.]|nr:DNA polymerase III subunit delta [Solobacterium sp.]
MIYLLEGTETYRMAKAREDIIKKSGVLPENIQNIDGSVRSSFSLSDVLSACSTISLFGDRRTVIIDSPYFLHSSRSRKEGTGKSEPKDQNIARLLERYCADPNDDADLILYCFGYDADKRTKEYKVLSGWFNKTVEHRTFSQMSRNELNIEIDRTLRENGLRLTRDARQELDERIDGSTTQFYRAMDKLLLYGASDLDRVDIEHLIPVNPEVNVWKFGDAFLRGDAAGMMRYLDELVTIERMSHQAVIPLLAYRLRSVYNVVRCDECGMSFDRIDKYTGRRFPERELRSARGMTSKDILAILDRLAALDQQIKNGTIGGKEGFEQFLLGRIKQCNH